MVLIAQSAYSRPMVHSSVAYPLHPFQLVGHVTSGTHEISTALKVQVNELLCLAEYTLCLQSQLQAATIAQSLTRR